MCEGSMYEKNRKATSTETLEIRPLSEHPTMKGTYSTKPGFLGGRDNHLVCVLPGTKMVIEEVKLESRRLSAKTSEWAGKKYVEATFDSYHRSSSRWSDCLVMPDGHRIHLIELVTGTRINIGVPFKRDLDKTLNLNNPDPDIALERAEPINEAGEQEAINLAARRRLESIEGDD